ncbi:uncharacterized protein BDW47DRAFT_125408 [Aspergillus candidus]|uniref:Uncharacterized protein n=1 Tax=Aspergillus candidus TaxID=41067 RepID=A0A2I2FDA6_ASPCN|nr:hypothetical protein BDW47DRAFT_125408 [Aspergillus candidus]PLB38577.1 hypothetical protein BDW47DRAFT_125408 [Aspergillus candidus]
MCGPPRPSSGNRIAIMHSTNNKKTSQYAICFHDRTAADAGTRAFVRFSDAGQCQRLRGRGVNLRIEKHGDLTASAQHHPLHAFQLPHGWDEREFELPERLDLGVSERGIVGRRVTVTVDGVDGWMDMGVVGYD